jgi:putative ABC transport system permease protein
MWRKRKQQDFNAELEAHLQLEADQLRSEGVPGEEVQAAARRALGNRTSAQERFYESSHWMPFQHFLRDLRFATRMLLKDAKFSVLAILGLALGIGVSTGIFAVLGPMLKPHGSNVRVMEDVRNPASYVGLDRGPSRNFSFPEYRYFQDHSTALGEISAESSPRSLILNPIAEGADAEDVLVTFESANSLSVLGMHPALGRSFSKEEEQTGAPAVAILSYRFWQRRFAGNASILAKTIVLNAHAVAIVGVADPKFHQDDTTAVFLPLGLQPSVLDQGDWLRDPGARWLMVSARLRPGVSISQAQAEADVLGNSFAESTHPGTARSVDNRVLVSPGGVDRQTQRITAGVTVAVNLIVAMILFIACSNLANLLLARAVVRRREIGVRLSLGASRARLICQLLTESLLLSVAGGAVGLVFSYWLVKALSAQPSLARLFSGSEPPLDHRGLLYALALSVATGLAFGLGPALAATKTNLARALHAEGLSGTPSAPSQKMWAPRNLLVVAPLAVSLMLLIGAAVLVRGLQGASFKPRFDTSRVIGMTFRLKAQGYDESKSLQFQENLRERMSTMPGVVSAALASAFPIPVLPPFGGCSLETDGPVISPGGRFECDTISAGYFETLGIPIVRGRAFSPSDREGSDPVAIVNQQLARTYWPGQEPIGKRMRSADSDTYFQIVGVAADLQDPGKLNQFRLLPTAYVPTSQASLLFASQKNGMRGARVSSYQASDMQFLVRTNRDSASVKTELRQAVRVIDPSVWVSIQTIEERLEPLTGPQSVIALFLSGFGALALLMACAGIYAILAYAVSQRTREIGIRIALGAQRREILSMVMRRTVILIAWGIGAGLAGALALSRILMAAVQGIRGLDAGTCISVTLLLGAASLLASYLPSRKALRVDSVQALRCE